MTWKASSLVVSLLLGLTATGSAQTCIDNLVKADSNGDEFLSQSEFGVLLQLDSNCTNLDAVLIVNEAQQAAYLAAVAAQCAASGDRNCLASFPTRQLSIAGASSRTPTLEQQKALRAICSAFGVLNRVKCSDSRLSVDLEECRTTLQNADFDGSNSIGPLEYRFFLKDYNDCDDMVFSLNLAEQAVFVSMSCLSGDASCLLNPASASIDISDLSNVLILSTICRSTAQLACQEGVHMPEELPVGSPEVMQDCVDDLMQVDVNEDEKLTVDEYLALVMQRSENQQSSVPDESCVNAEYELSNTQNIVFQTLACTSCASGGESPTCCLEGSETADISIAGAATDVAPQQSAFLASICTAASAVGGYMVRCENEENDKSSKGGCLDDMASSDKDQDGFLDLNEFSDLLSMRGSEYCYESAGALSPALQSAFSTACVASGVGPLNCLPDNPQAHMSLTAPLTVIDVVCSAIENEVSSSTCDEDEQQTRPATKHPDPLPTKPNICLDDMKASDGNQDGFLDASDIYEFVMLRGAPYCYEESGGTLSPEMQNVLLKLCLASGRGALNCAQGRARMELDSPGYVIATVCSAIDAEVSKSTCGDGGDYYYTPSSSPVAGSGKEDEKPASTTNKKSDCLADMRLSDNNQDGFLDAGDLYNLVSVRGTPYCYNSGGALSADLQSTFLRLCLASGAGASNCVPGSTQARLPLDSPETVLDMVCAVIDNEVSSSTCDEESQPTMSPSTPSRPGATRAFAEDDNRGPERSVIASVFGGAGMLLVAACVFVVFGRRLRRRKALAPSPPGMEKQDTDETISVAIKYQSEWHPVTSARPASVILPHSPTSRDAAVEVEA